LKIKILDVFGVSLSEDTIHIFRVSDSLTRIITIDEKIPLKNLSKMNIFQKSNKILSRYNLALLCLPMVTSNGKSSRVNRAKGNDIEFLSGYNYKDAALDKYLR
jgi:hypothetical protein